MASRTYQQALSSGGATATTNASAATYTDNVSASFALDASSTYLVIAYCEHQVNNTTAQDGQLRLYDGTTALCTSNFRNVSADASEWTPVNLAAVITTTSAVTPTLSLGHKLAAASSGRLSSARNGVIIALKLGTNDASMSNDVAGTSTSAAGTYTDYAPASGTATLTFTPPSSGDYLIFAFATKAHSNTTTGARIRLLCEDGTTATLNDTWSPAGNSSSKVSYCGFTKRTGLAASSQTFKLQHCRHLTSGTSTLDQVRMVAFRLADFDASNVTEDTTSRTTTSGSYVDITTTQADTLTNTIDYLLLGNYRAGTDNNAILYSAKLSDGTNDYSEGQRKESWTTGQGVLGQLVLVPRIITGSGASVTHRIKGKITSVLTETVGEHRFGVLQVESAGADASVTVPAAVAAVSSVPWTTVTAEMGTFWPARAISTTWLYDTSGNPVMWDSGTHVMAPSGGAQPTIGLTWTTLTAPATSAVGTPTISATGNATATGAGATSGAGAPTIGMTSAGMRAAAVSAVGTPTISMSGPFSDDFNRADGPVGNTWTTAFGSLTYGDAAIASNKLAIPPGSLYSRGFVYRNFGTADGTFTVHRDGYLGQGMILRYQDALNFIYIDSTSLVVWVNNGGAGTATYTIGSGLDLKVVLAGSSIKASSDGTNNWSVDIVDTHFQTATIHGIWGGAAGPPSATFDNFAYTPDVDVPARVAAATSAVGTPTISGSGNPTAQVAAASSTAAWAGYGLTTTTMTAAAVSGVGQPGIGITTTSMTAAAVSAVGTPTIGITTAGMTVPAVSSAGTPTLSATASVVTFVGPWVYDANGDPVLLSDGSHLTWSTPGAAWSQAATFPTGVISVPASPAALVAAAVSAVGTPTLSASSSPTPTTAAAVSTVGTPTLQLGSDISVSAERAIATSTAGTPTISATADAPATGAGAVSAAGTPTLSATGQPAALVAGATSTVGTPTLSATGNASATGAGASSTAAWAGYGLTYPAMTAAAVSGVGTPAVDTGSTSTSANAQRAIAISGVGTPSGFTIDTNITPAGAPAGSNPGQGPSLQITGNATPAVAVALSGAASPTISVDRTATPTTAAALSGAAAPTVAITIFPAPVAAISGVGTPLVQAPGQAPAQAAVAISGVPALTLAITALPTGLRAVALSGVGAPTFTATGNAPAQRAVAISVPGGFLVLSGFWPASARTALTFELSRTVAVVARSTTAVSLETARTLARVE